MSDGKQAGTVWPAVARVLSSGEWMSWALVREALLAGLGGALAIGVLGIFTRLMVTPLIIAPFGASCVLLTAVPASPLAQPRNVIAGHMLSALVGLAVLAVFGSSSLAMAVGVGLAIVVMRLTGTIHPPAGANPIVVMALGAPWWFFLVPVGLGAAILVGCAILYHRFVTRVAYPRPG